MINVTNMSDVRWVTQQTGWCVMDISVDWSRELSVRRFRPFQDPRSRSRRRVTILPLRLEDTAKCTHWSTPSPTSLPDLYSSVLYTVYDIHQCILASIATMLKFQMEIGSQFSCLHHSVCLCPTQSTERCLLPYPSRGTCHSFY
jgi:hypothetical protein